ncbi:MAG: sulfatase-like hydrolase/transferase [Fimbriimonadaceae bacterium]|nr:sulfatase-like hydrolase/transferase [Fimbriimonadaceae bacterium]
MEAGRPNILLLFPDQWRADWLGCAGASWLRTPVLDALAARGVRFTRAYCTAPLCAPSRASLAAGRRPHRVGVHTNDDDFPLDQPTFYQHLRGAGYRVAVVGKCDLHKATHVNGPDGWTPRLGVLGFTEACDSAGKWDAVNHCRPEPHDPYTRHLARHHLLDAHVADYAKRRALPKPRGVWASPLPTEHHPDSFVGGAAVRLLEQFPRQAPWYLQVNFPSPHEPYDPPAEWLERWQDADLPQPLDPGPRLSPAEHLAARRSYAALLEMLDHQIGRLLATVEARGELEQTLVVFASDHGEMLGDHQAWGKQTFYEPAMAVPLLVAGPGVTQPGRTCDALVELPDLAPTCLAAAGLEPPEQFEARSLTGLLDGSTSEHRDEVVSLLPGHRAIATRRFKLVVRDGQIAVLFDLEEDPLETGNLAERHPEMLTRLAERLGEELGGE